MTSIFEGVIDATIEKILISLVPQFEHFIGDLAPKSQRLEAVVILSIVGVSEASTLSTALDGERIPWVKPVGSKILLQVANHLLHRITGGQ